MSALKLVKMERPRSEEIFRRATEVLVGGVNSPVRAFRAVAEIPSSSIARQARACGTPMGMSISTTCVPGAH